MLDKLLKNKMLSGLAIGSFIAVITGLLAVLNPLDAWNLKATDSLYTLNEPSADIVIIAIDEKSNQAPPVGLGRYAHWSRDNFTNLLKKLEFENTKVIAFDVIFNNNTQTVPLVNIADFQLEQRKLKDSEKIKNYDAFFKEYSSPHKNPIDAAFAEQLARFDNVILAMTASDEVVIGPISKFAEHTTQANVSGELDADGILRDTPLEPGGHKNFALTVAEKFRGEELEVPTQDGKMNINYFADPLGYEMVSFVDVLNGEFDNGAFTDKIVLIGATSFKEVADDVLTPRSNTVPMHGVEAWANQIQTILEGKFLAKQSATSQIIFLSLLSIALTIVLTYLGIALSILLVLGLGIGHYFSAKFLYGRGTVMNLIYPYIAILLSFISAWLYKFFITDRKKREIKSAFGHYVSKDLVEEISKHPEMLKLGGEKREITVFFSDIVGSTAISERTDIEIWVGQINEYFTTMERILKASGGTLDKYEGDAIMGFWNAPVLQQDHMTRAYNAALNMKKALIDLNERWADAGKPVIQVRMGINSGETIVGNFGSEDRFDYTVMGDTVNVASRLESAANKTYGSSIMIAGGAPLEPAQYLTREIDMVYLRGKETAVKIHELICFAADASEEIKSLAGTYAKGLEAYRASDWATAIKYFSSLPNDPASKVMLARCNTLQAGQKVAGLESNMSFRIAL